MKMLKTKKGFTLIELMIVVAIIGILAAIAIPQFANLVAKSQEGATKGNLGTIRSALSIYYGDTEGVYPSDALSGTTGSLTAGQKYLQTVPAANTPHTVNNVGHTTTNNVNAGTFAAYVTDAGGWSYDNATTDPTWGSIVVNCEHEDLRGSTWTAY